MNITGTIVNYYFHCKRQCWLFANRINLEDESENVRIGKVLHELKAEKEKNSEISIDHIKLDKITENYLVEFKKSDADLEAVKWQVLYYLKVLQEKGIHRKGKIIVEEKKKQSKKTHYVELTDLNIRKLEQVIKEIETYIHQPKPADVIHEGKCRKCAYYNYCYV